MITFSNLANLVRVEKWSFSPPYAGKNCLWLTLARFAKELGQARPIVWSRNVQLDVFFFG